MAELSVWKRPSDVMKIHRRRKSVSQKKITVSDQQRTNVIFRSPSKSVKRRNPFNCDDNSRHATKRRNVGDNNGVTISRPVTVQDNALFNILDCAQKGISSSVCQSMSPTDVISHQTEIERETRAVGEKKENHVAENIASDREAVRDISATLPVDWSLKTKLRVVSSSPLSWCTQLRSADEAQGIARYVHNTQSQLETTTDEKREFQKSCMYWIHPNIPWVRLFPRIIDSNSKCYSQLLQDDIQASLQSDWEGSFTSVFHQFRSGLCPYFYLCTHQFTVLFCCENETQSSMVAMVTPTTRGLRESLKSEGLDFTLPVGEKLHVPHQTAGSGDGLTNGRDVVSAEDTDQPPQEVRASGDAGSVGDDDDDLLDTDDAASGWLESMGLDKKQFPSLDPSKVKLQREGFRVIDNRPESLVLVRGGNVHALFNFLLNCRTCTATSGTQAGVPPTILSPSAFKGAVLKSHRVKHTAVKQTDRDGNISQAHIVEVAGPILPQHTQSLVSLLHRTQAADFGIVLNNHDFSVPFNVITRLAASPNKGDVANDGVVDRERLQDQDICNFSSNKFFERKPISTERVCAVKEIVCSRDGFTWVS